MPAPSLSCRRFALVGLCALALSAGLAQSAAAQPAAGAQRTAYRQPDPIPQRETLIRLSRTITVDFNEQRLADVITFLRDYTMAEIEPLWMDDRHSTGLDPERTVTLSARNITVLRLIERILEQARDDFSEPTWQMADTGAIQIGPRDRLNQWKRIVVYDINDLLMEIPEYDEVPRIDLNQALQASGQGGGGQSPFQGGDDRDDRQRRQGERQERAEALVDLIMEIVETESWVANGGNGGTIRIYRGNLIVNAPDYMHRGIMGYPYWPARATVASMQNGRRYVSLTTDNSISALARMALQPVTLTTGGGGSSEPPPPPPGR